MTDYVHITTSCGVDQIVAEGAVEWVTDRYAHAHSKGLDGLSAGGCELLTGPAPDPEIEAGA